MMKHVDILIIGGGAAGISAATAAWNAGGRRILIVEQRDKPGGILLQCSHPGFLFHTDSQGNFEYLTGVEYAGRLTAALPPSVELMLSSSVLSVHSDRTADVWDATGRQIRIRFFQLILAAGCREIPFESIGIAGTRPLGIYSAGQMQEMINCLGFHPDGPAVILGAGDLGMIMADSLAKIDIPVTIVEKTPKCTALQRNQKCLSQKNITLLCSSSIVRVFGDPLLTGVLLTDGTHIACSTLLCAVGMRPDQSLAEPLVTNSQLPDWVHLCGNCRQIHPIIDSVVLDGKQTGKNSVDS